MAAAPNGAQNPAYSLPDPASLSIGSMMSEKARVDALAFASPVIAVVAALFMSGCLFAAGAMSDSSALAKARLLLKAGMLAFALAEALALVLGISGILRVKLGRSAKGFPESLLGIIAACLFGLTALLLYLSWAAPPAP